MVYILLGTGFEEVEAVAPADVLRRAEIPMQLVGIGGKIVEGAHGIRVEADITLEQMDLTAMDMIVLPGGMGGVESVLGSSAALDAVRFAAENDKFVAAICAAPTILAGLGLLEGKKATCYPGLEGDLKGAQPQPDAQVVVDGKIITGRAPGAAVEFGLTLMEQLSGQASYTADYVAERMVYDR